MQINDNQLIERILAGETTLFAQLIERYQLVIFNVMMRYCGSYEIATELTQDFFCSLYQKLGRYRGKGSFFSWLYTLALNHARDWSRKQKSDREKIERYSLENFEHTDHQSPVADLEQLEATESLNRALSEIAEEKRELLILRFRHDRSIKELSEIFNLSESGVKMRIHRSLIELRSLIDQAM